MASQSAYIITVTLLKPDQLRKLVIFIKPVEKVLPLYAYHKRLDL